MKIIDARTGKLQQIPFSLGEAGRGRWLEEVKVSNRPGQEPSGPEDVGYFLFGNEKKHCILTKSSPSQRGILLHIDTQGTYTRGTSGSVALKGGKATLLVSGEYAYGDAGRIGGGSDELWHVESPSVFVVNICGGSYKGYGHRYLFVTKNFETVMIKREDLCQMIATDENPEVVEVAKQFADQLHEDVQSAIKLAGQLEEAMDSPESTISVNHFTHWQTIEEVVKGWGIAVPTAMGDKIGGVSGVQAGTLIPGTKALAALRIGPGGGKRYRFEKVSEAGITRLKESCERPYTSEGVLALVESPDWYSAWIEYKDGEITSYALANVGGIHHYFPNPQWSEKIRTESWEGMTPVSPTEEEMRKIFKLNAEEPPKEDKPEGGWGIDDLQRKFGK